MNFLPLLVLLLVSSTSDLVARRSRAQVRKDAAAALKSGALKSDAVKAAEELHGEERPEAETTFVDVSGQYRAVDSVLEEAKRAAESELRAAEREKEALARQVKKQKDKIQEKADEFVRKEKERLLRLEREVSESVKEVEKRAKKRAEETVLEGKRKAADLKEKLDAQDTEDRKNGRVPVTDEWRREILRDFEKSAGFVRQVVMEGEVSRVERQNFIALFDDQAKWFNKKIKEAEFYFDEKFNAAIEKKNALAVVVDAQRQADDCIVDLVHEYHFPAKVQAQLRLLALYEINNHLEHAKEGVTVFLSSDVIENLVGKISLDLIPGRREIKIVSEKDKVSRLEARIAELEEQARAIEKYEQMASEGQEHARQHGQVREQLLMLRQERDTVAEQLRATEESYKSSHERLVHVLERKERQRVELEVQLGQVAEQLKILAEHSQSGLTSLVQKLSAKDEECRKLAHDKEVERKKFVEEAEGKARKKAELEVAIAQVTQEIGNLRTTSTHLVDILSDKLEAEKEHGKVLGELLSRKQREAAELEIELRGALQKATDEKHFQVKQLQAQVAELRTTNKDMEQALDGFKQQVEVLIKKSQQETVQLFKQLHEQQGELDKRRDVYKNMEQLQAKLEKNKQKRAQDSRAAAAQVQLITQMTSFGDALLADYNKLYRAAKNACDVDKELAHLLVLLRDTPEELDQADILKTLDTALQLLGETAAEVQEGIKQGAAVQEPSRLALYQVEPAVVGMEVTIELTPAPQDAHASAAPVGQADAEHNASKAASAAPVAAVDSFALNAAATPEQKSRRLDQVYAV